MARVKGPLTIVGNLKGISLYTVKGSDTVFVRTKGGPKKNRIKTGKEFEKLRQHQGEWPGAIMFSKCVRYCIFDLLKLGDYNVTPVLNGMGKRLMKLDTVNPIGQRSVMISKAKDELAGFDLNRNFPFSSVLRTSLTVTIDKSVPELRVQIPRLRTATDIYNVQKLPYFKLLFALSYIPDVHYRPDSDQQNKYYPDTDIYPNGTYTDGLKVETEWLSTNDIIEAQELKIAYEASFTEEQLNMITFLATGAILFGAPAKGGVIEMVDHACCAKILTVE